MNNYITSQINTNMSHIELVVTGTWAIITKTFATNLIPKAVTSFFTVFYGLIVTGNETIIGAIFLLYFIDLFTWVSAALYNREWESRKFFMWCTKLLIYWIFAAIWVSLWEALYLWNFFLSGIFAFIVITDSSSILENLEKLWYHTPIFISKYLKVAQKNLERRYTDSITNDIIIDENKTEQWDNVTISNI